MMHGDVYCEHCEMQADLCDCGADYEMSYRPGQIDQYRSAPKPSSGLGWVALIIATGGLMVLRVLMFG